MGVTQPSICQMGENNVRAVIYLPTHFTVSRQPEGMFYASGLKMIYNVIALNLLINCSHKGSHSSLKSFLNPLEMQLQ